MSHVCRNCNRAFGSSLELALHRDTCGADDLLCAKCGEQFPEASATRDGWHYECPNEECDGAGIGEDLRALDAIRAH